MFMWLVAMPTLFLDSDNMVVSWEEAWAVWGKSESETSNYSRNEGGGIKENDGGEKSAKIYCKNLYKCITILKIKKYIESMSNRKKFL
jgi:hypothetical protein